MSHAVATSGRWLNPRRTGHSAESWWRSPLLRLVRLLTLGSGVLAVLPGWGVAQELSPVPAGSRPDPLQRSYHWLGSGRFQYDGQPQALAINPSGTLLVVSGDFFSGSLLLYSTPDGRAVPLPDDPNGPSAPEDPISPHGSVHWIDDRHIIIAGVQHLRDPSLHDLAFPFTYNQGDVFVPVLQIIDVVSGLRRTLRLPDGSSAASFVLTPDGSQACFLCPQLPALIFPTDEDARPNQGSAYGLGFISLASGEVRRGFATLPYSRRVSFTDYNLSADGRYLTVIVQRFTHRHVGPPTIQCWDVASGMLLHAVPIMPMEGICDLRSGRDADHLEVLWADPEHDFAPTTTTVSLLSGAQREVPGWTIVGTLPAAGHLLATIGTTAVTLPDHRSISFHARGIPAPLPWVDPSRRIPWINATIACDRGGHYYALAGATCVNLIDLRHALLMPQPDTALWCAPVQCAYLDDDTLVIISQEQVVMERPDGQLRRVLPLPTLEMTPMSAFGGAMVAGQTRLAHQRQQSVVWDAGRQRVLRPLAGVVDLRGVAFSTHQRFASYQQDLGQIVLADLEQPSRPEIVISGADGRSGQSFITWSDDDSLVCVSRIYEDPAISGVFSHATSAWDTRSGRQRWIACSASGWPMEQVVALIPDGTGDHVIALEQPLQADTPAVPPFLQSPTQETPRTVPTVLLDGHSGRAVRPLAFPGRDPAFTPDSTRIVGASCVIDIRDNHRVQEMPNAGERDAYFDLTPSHTWALVGTGSDWEAITDVAGAGIVLPVPVVGLTPTTRGLYRPHWNAGEDRIAFSSPSDARVLEQDLYPSPPAASDLVAAMRALDQGPGAEWLLAACALARCGEGAVTLLRQAPVSAHRIIALERCAAAGSASALAVLDADRALPGPLGLLASDAWARQQRALQAKHLAQAHAHGP